MVRTMTHTLAHARTYACTHAQARGARANVAKETLLSDKRDVLEEQTRPATRARAWQKRKETREAKDTYWRSKEMYSTCLPLRRGRGAA